jgi:hypothetical protein
VINWKPIATAQTYPERPGDGMPKLLLWYPGLGVETGRYVDDRFVKKPRPFWRRDSAFSTLGARNPQPTHWAPLPEGPK